MGFIGGQKATSEKEKHLGAYERVNLKILKKS